MFFLNEISDFDTTSITSGRFLLEANQIPFALVFTKLDKCKQAEFQRNFNEISKKLLTEWEELPPVFFTSADSGRGCLDILTYIDQLNQDFVNP